MECYKLGHEHGYRDKQSWTQMRATNCRLGQGGRKHMQTGMTRSSVPVAKKWQQWGTKVRRWLGSIDEATRKAMVVVTYGVRPEAEKWLKSSGNIAKNGGVACGKRGYYDS